MSNWRTHFYKGAETTYYFISNSNKLILIGTDDAARALAEQIVTNFKEVEVLRENLDKINKVLVEVEAQRDDAICFIRRLAADPDNVKVCTVCKMAAKCGQHDYRHFKCFEWKDD